VNNIAQARRNLKILKKGLIAYKIAGLFLNVLSVLMIIALLTYDKEFSLETVVIPMILFILATASWVAQTVLVKPNRTLFLENFHS
jgi:hypothetical protein